MGKGQKHSIKCKENKSKLINRHFLNVVHNNPVAHIFAEENRFLMMF